MYCTELDTFDVLFSFLFLFCCVPERNVQDGVGDEELAPKQEAILLTFPNSCPISSLLRPTPEEALIIG